MPSGIVIQIGPLRITETVVTTWGIMTLLLACAGMVFRRLSIEPGWLQVMVEGVLEAIEDTIRSVLPAHARLVYPLIGTLWIFLAVANLAGIVPGLHSPTADLSATAALAVVVFCAVPWFGIRTQGVGGYVRHYLAPTPILLPFHLISELTRTLALAVRLFGNIMSLEMALLLILIVAGFLVPVPILVLHIIEGLIQAFIFGMLALIYIGGAMQSQHLRAQSERKESP
jgi:F-type H+-transporting ATPase subunit a